MGDIAKDIQSKFPNVWIKALINISYTSNWLNGLGEKKFGAFGISAQQYNVLRILKGQGKNAISVNNIMSRMIDKMSNASRLVEKLRQKELIERVICEHDRRQVDVKITKKGLKLLSTLDNMMNEFEILKSKITEKEAIELSEILEKMRK